MTSSFRWVASVLLGGCICVLAACGGDGSGSGTTADAGAGSGSAPGSGTAAGPATLSLAVAGLPAGTDANVSVAGPGNFQQTVTRSATLPNLAAGTYTITAGDVLNGTSLYNAAQATQSVTVDAGNLSPTVTVAYNAPETMRLSLAAVAGGLDAPIYLTAPANDPRLFVVERPGRIRVIRNGALLGTPFLDISSLTTTDGERGLLSMAFDPDFATNGRFFVYYTDTGGAITVARYRVTTPGADVADASGTVLLSIPHPGQSNHNGGQLAFGPDGMLYLGTGDGGGANDPPGNAQNNGSLLGKMLRIDVRGNGYAVPPDNPFASGGGGRGEVWARGLRNPWRFSFDSAGLVYIADVGQDAREEVNIVPASAPGLNYGWVRLEGTVCVNGTNCDTTGLTPPAFEYSHDDGSCAILGGFVYAGSAVPELKGRYFYTDLCKGALKSFAYRGGTVSESIDWSLPLPGTVYSFGKDAAGELYVLAETSAGGQVLRLQRAP
ncbi:PQQ-dependent sugar dehydrogenase [Cupriavidus sp. H18C2]|uniref:PQQ-dependent sugar dehydrogenase n=1 Tax=Cupriavidus sp. H18C2 TaxID=3241602 RepID=UPI003BF90F6D